MPIIPASQREEWKERKVVMLGVLADKGRVIFLDKYKKGSWARVSFNILSTGSPFLWVYCSTKSFAHVCNLECLLRFYRWQICKSAPLSLSWGYPFKLVAATPLCSECRVNRLITRACALCAWEDDRGEGGGGGGLNKPPDMNTQLWAGRPVLNTKRYKSGQ